MRRGSGFSLIPILTALAQLRDGVRLKPDPRLKPEPGLKPDPGLPT
jgi:hypothetical protein